eukprot:749835-Pelagomonas_calceolata.AAC.4
MDRYDRGMHRPGVADGTTEGEATKGGATPVFPCSCVLGGPDTSGAGRSMDFGRTLGGMPLVMLLSPDCWLVLPGRIKDM